jgi:hypothetical protein
MTNNEKIHTPGEMEDIQKDRILSEAEALKSGARMREKGRVMFTEEQINVARNEMRYDKDPVYKKMFDFRASIRDIIQEMSYDGKALYRCIWTPPMSREDIDKRKEYFERLKDVLSGIEKQWVGEHGLRWFMRTLIDSRRTLDELLDLDKKILENREGEIGGEFTQKKISLGQELHGQWSGFRDGVNIMASFLDLE